MKKNQKGFTLVELIIAVAIVAIVSVTIVSFMIAGSRSYASSSTETNIQQEAQIAMNQISDLIIDTSKAVTYTYQADAGDTEHFVMKESEIPENPYCKRLCMYNGHAAYEVIWKNDGNNRLYYTEYDVTPDGDKQGTPSEYLLSDYVTSFQADLTNLQEKRVVQLDVDFEKGERRYHASNNITIRNKIVVNDLDDYDAPPVTGGTVDLVTVQGPVYLAPNESYTFEKPLISGSGAPGQEVIWSFENAGDHSPDTTIDQNGTIKIGKTETHSNFRVKAAAKADPEKAGFITVNLIRINSVNLTTNQANFIPESKFSVAASLEDFNMGFDGTGTGTSVTWSIEEGASYINDLGLTSEGRHSYYIKKGVADRAKIRIRATSNHSLHWNYPGANHIYGELEITVAGISESKFGIGEEYLIGDADGYAAPDFNASYVRYVKIESSEPNQNDWVNVGDIYENDGFFRGTYQTQGEFAGWYDIHNYDAVPKMYVPRKLDLNLDYRLTMCEEATEKDVHDREPRKRVLIILQEIVRRTRFVFTSTSPQAPVISADHVNIHAYILDRRWDSKTAWSNYSLRISDQPGSITSDGIAELRFTWHGGPDDGFLRVDKTDQYPEFRVDLNRAGEAGTYRFWPTVSYAGRSYDREESYVEWKVDVGNMKLKGEDVFLPYPSHPEFANALAVMEANRAEEKKTNVYFRNKNQKERVESRQYYFLVTKDAEGTYTIQVFADRDFDKQNRIGVFRCTESETRWTEVRNP